MHPSVAEGHIGSSIVEKKKSIVPVGRHLGCYPVTLQGGQKKAYKKAIVTGSGPLGCYPASLWGWQLTN